MPANRRRQTSGPPPTNIAPLVAFGAVVAAGVAAWFGFPPAVAAWAGLVAAAWSATPATLTGKKDSFGYPSAANPAEVKAQRSWELWRQLRHRLVFPNGDWAPGWPVLASWLAACWAAAVFYLWPVRVFFTGVGAARHQIVSVGVERAGDAAAAYLIVAVVAAGLRRRAGDSHPGTRADAAAWAAARSAPIGSALGTGVGAVLGMLAGATVLAADRSYRAYLHRFAAAAHGRHVRPLPGWHVTLVHPGLIVPLFALGGATFGFGVGWRREAVRKWEKVHAGRGEWAPRWEALKVDPAPTLVDRREVGGATVDTFVTFGSPGASMFWPMGPKIAPTLGPGRTVAVLECPDVSDAGPTPGTRHPSRFEVAVWPSDQIPDLSDVGLDVETVVLYSHAVMVWALEPAGYGRPVPLGAEAVHGPDSPVAVWVTSWAWPAGPSLAEIRPLRSSVEAVARCDVLVDHREDVVYFGSCVGDRLDRVGFADPSMAETLVWVDREDSWNESWAATLKSGANPPTLRPETYKEASLAPGGQTVFQQAFLVRMGIDPSEYHGLEAKLATALDGAPFVSIVGWPAKGDRPGSRHPQAVAVHWSKTPLPTSPERVGKSPAARWVLAGLVNSAFDAARLARPEVSACRTLSSDGSFPMLWEMTLRLYGGVTVADVRRATPKLRQHLGVPWLRVAPDEDGVALYAGGDPAVVDLGGDDRDVDGLRARLVALDWEQAFYDAGVVTASGMLPELVGFETMPTNRNVSVVDFRLPAGVSAASIRASLGKLKAATGNSFAEVRLSPHGASAVRLCVSVDNPLPERVDYDFEEADRMLADGRGVPFATSVDGTPACFDPVDNPHVLLAGVTGSGKSVMAQSFLYGFAASGAALVVIDPQKGAADFAFVRPWAEATATTTAEAVSALRSVYAEVVRRKDIISAAGVGSFLDLPVPPPRIVVMVDEFTSLMGTSQVPPATDDPDLDVERDAVIADNRARTEIGVLVGKLAREARSAGVVLLLGTQKMSAKMLESVPGGGDLKTNLARVLLGKASSGDRMSALRSALDAPELDGDIPKGRGVWESLSSTAEVIQCWYAPQQEYADRLRQRRGPEARLGVLDPPGDGDGDAAGDADGGMFDVGVLSFSLDDLEGAVGDDVPAVLPMMVPGPVGESCSELPVMVPEADVRPVGEPAPGTVMDPGCAGTVLAVDVSLLAVPSGSGCDAWDDWRPDRSLGRAVDVSASLCRSLVRLGVPVVVVGAVPAGLADVGETIGPAGTLSSGWEPDAVCDWAGRQAGLRRLVWAGRTADSVHDPDPQWRTVGEVTAERLAGSGIGLEVAAVGGPGGMSLRDLERVASLLGQAPPAPADSPRRPSKPTPVISGPAGAADPWDADLAW